MNEMLIPQLFGLFSFILGAFCFMQKDDKKFKCIMLVLNINHSIHFILMGAVTSACSTLLGALRTATSMKTASKKVAYLFIIALIVVNAQWAQYWYDWLSVLGASFGTYGLFCLRGIQMRVALLIGSVIWLVNNIIVNSIGGIMLESMVIGINLSTMIRLYKAQNNELSLQN
ncbi:YgjV family protein [Catenovulum sediminis]|uniref:YgjV family protein n=1 Tax=Catenovulum sediminis TaxID=1740262 RepID=UPI00117C4669|nr:YgjV family protein [Catenovulum sediminis]